MAMWKLRHFLSENKKEVILGPMFKLLEAIFELIVPLVIASMIDDGVRCDNKNVVIRCGITLIILAVTGLSSTLVCQRFASIASQNTGTRMRHAFFSHVMTFSHAEIDRFGTDSLVTRYTADINQLQLAAAMLIRLVIRAPFLAIGSIIMTFFIDPRLSLIVLTATPLVLLVLYLVMSRTIPMFSKMRRQLDRTAQIVSENLVGVRVIRAFRGQPREEKRFRDKSEEMSALYRTSGAVSGLLDPLTCIIMNIAIAVLLGAGAVRVSAGSLSQGEVVALVSYITQMMLALVVVANLVVTFTKAEASAVRVNEVFETEPSVTDKRASADAVKTLSEFDSKSEVLNFENVTFSYPSAGEPSVDKISFSVKARETVGFIGSTGSGKSTVAALASRFYDISDGSINFCGIPIHEIPLAELHAHIAVVPQHLTLVSGTVGSNLRYGSSGADDEILIKALTAAQALDFVTEKGGLDAPVEQNGRNFSGGQRQRLTVARALVSVICGAKLLILDDVSSALDTETDRKMRGAIRKLTEEYRVAVILISQRISSMKGTDRVILLDDGAVAASGTHKELARSCELYREIMRSQSEPEPAKEASENE